MNSDNLFDFASKFSSQQWMEVLIKSIKTREIGGVKMPAFPPDHIQAGFVGSSNEHALKEAFVFYSIIQNVLKHEQATLTPDSKVLDFGCGWGRYTRFFYRDVYHENLYMVDPWQMIIDLCKENGLYGQLLKINLLPPVIFNDKTFDFAFAYSVFSHLSEQAANKWIEEFARIIRPSGYLIITTQGRSFIEFCKKIRMNKPKNQWEETLANSFVDESACYSKYDAGGFLYAANGGGEALPSDIYGDALVSKGYVKKNWTKNFELIDFVDDRAVLPQAYMVLRRK